MSCGVGLDQSQFKVVGTQCWPWMRVKCWLKNSLVTDAAVETAEYQTAACWLRGNTQAVEMLQLPLMFNTWNVNVLCNDWTRARGGDFWNLLPYFHGLFIVMAEEVVGLVGSDGLSAVHAQVKHCNEQKALTRCPLSEETTPIYNWTDAKFSLLFWDALTYSTFFSMCMSYEVEVTSHNNTDSSDRSLSERRAKPI